MFSKDRWPWLLIGFYVLLIGIPYLANFSAHGFSSSPSDWGALGDYFGGLINPASSLVALYFLIKAYSKQKQELEDTRAALEQTAGHQKDAAQAQKELAELEARRLHTAEKLLMAQSLSAQISSDYQYVVFLSSEIDRCTVAINGDRYTFNTKGNKLYTDREINDYRIDCLRRIDRLVERAEELKAQLKELYEQ
ncbi:MULTISPECIES: hypothetical protein [Pseudomonas]|uniref:hypothetical protein n=1 Tax=Pseudomonas TaxID=286 RepID=UPI0015F92C65|nr:MULTISPECIES: hypothetical protein [Pseudomonas]MBA6139198.1 hypothetical protein [Pseudomonas monteilii]MDT3748846.1 hypothetical protein [Pseudomonas kurunegalensis]